VISRVAGFTCLYILNGHSASVTGLAVVERDKSAGVHTTCLVSSYPGPLFLHGLSSNKQPTFHLFKQAIQPTL